MGRAKEYLRQIRKLDIQISQLIKERDSLRAFDGVSAIQYRTDLVQTSFPGSAPFERSVATLIAVEEELDRLIDDYVSIKRRIIGEIQGLENTNHVELLFKRYVEYKSFETIATEMHYSYIWVCQMHGYALQDFERTYTNI